MFYLRNISKENHSTFYEISDPDVLAGDGIYSGFFKPDPINALTTYTISARIKGFTVSNTFTRSLPIDQGEKRLLIINRNT